MNKILVPMLSVMLVVLSACNHDDAPINIKLIKGQWEMVDADGQGSGHVYDFRTQNDMTWSYGSLTTYFMTSIGAPIYDKAYTWNVTVPNADSEDVFLDITFIADLDGADQWENTTRYKVISLTHTDMVLRVWTVGDTDTVLRFIRRNDLSLDD